MTGWKLEHISTPMREAAKAAARKEKNPWRMAKPTHPGGNQKSGESPKTTSQG